MYVKNIDLSLEEFLEYKNDDFSKVNLEKTNIFIGKNNSGKSRLMRKVLMHEYKKVYYVNKDVDDFVKMKDLIEKIISNMSEYVKNAYKRTYLSTEKIKEKVYRNKIDEENLAKFVYNLLYYEEENAISRKIAEKGIVNSNLSFDRNFPDNSGKRIEKSELRKLYCKILDEKENIVPETIFFPSLLSLRKLNNIQLDGDEEYHLGISKIYSKDYFSSVKGFENIKTGQEIYNDMKKQLLGLNKDRKNFLKYEEYLSENFFDNKEISVFIKDDDKNVYIKENNEKEYPIYMLGDGLQTLITITYYLFMNDDKPLKVFMDEPEIHLHPGLQRMLIEKMQEFNNCQFFITTHSSSMIDICDEYDKDMAIVCVDKIDGQKIVYNSTYDDMDLYKLIGIRPSSIILSNCTIWVEGPTDIYYIDSFLKLFTKIKGKRKYVLGYNYNYAFNGSINIASKIDFSNEEKMSMKINKISKNNFVIFDSDNLNKENVNYEKIQKIREKLDNRCAVVNKLKTIENIIPPTLLKEYFEENYNSRDKTIKPLVLKFFDYANEEVDVKDYYQLDIADEMAEYINKRVKNKDIKKYRKYCNNLWSSNKYNLAVYFSERINKQSECEQKELFNNTYNAFREMIKEIYKFIEENNK